MKIPKPFFRKQTRSWYRPAWQKTTQLGIGQWDRQGKVWTPDRKPSTRRRGRHGRLEIAREPYLSSRTP